jgi:hypothetical protein
MYDWGVGQTPAYTQTTLASTLNSFASWQLNLVEEGKHGHTRKPLFNYSIIQVFNYSSNHHPSQP